LSGTDTIPELLARRAGQQPHEPAYWQRMADGQWKDVSWGEVLWRARNLSGHLARLGLRPGDSAVLMLPTLPHWEYCQLGVLGAGGIVVGIDAHDAPENMRHILQTVRPRALFLASGAQWDALRVLMPEPPAIVVILEQAPVSGALELGGLLTTAAEDGLLPGVAADDTATIVFTSGSTGRPKGIAYTHRQLCLAGTAILARFPGIGGQTRLACWLPMSNLFQRIINLCAILRGAQCYFVDSPADIVARLPEIRPALFIGVPRFFEKLHAGIQAEVAKRSGFSRRAIRLAWSVGESFRRAQREGRRPGMGLAVAHALADRLVLRRLRGIMGPDLQFMVSGSAPMPSWLLERLHGLGWLVLEAYGISECVVPVAVAAPESFRFGSVGRPLPENEIRLADDMELLVRGAGVFRGGYLGDAAGEPPVDAQGYLHTGDYARLDEDGYLYLTGRKSEVFKTSTGRRIAPVPIESFLKQLPYVEHAVVLGRNRPVAVALLAVNSAPPAPDGAGGAFSPAGLASIGADALRVCESLPAYQRPAGVLVTRRGFSVAGGELTSNLKLKRSAIEEKFAAAINTLYADLTGAADHARCLVREAP